MTTDRTGVIFSDLDGTFLDERYYPVLDATRFVQDTEGWRVVWASSRTVEELLHLQDTLGHAEDAIGENGGVFVTRSEATALALGRPEPVGGAWMTRLASPHEFTEALVRGTLEEAQVHFRTLEDYSPKELAARAHYDTESAMRARHRRTSVLLSDVDLGDARVHDAFDVLRNNGCYVAHGGHWTSVVHGANKGTAARAWLARPWADQPLEAHTVVAIGNSDNDEPLLAMADLRFVIRNPDSGHSPALTAVPDARLLSRPGTQGWLEMLEIVSTVAERAR